jgi:hypothetical protein
MTLPPTGRRKRTAPVDSGVMGWVVTFHFDRPIGEGRPVVAQARHSVVWFAEHRLITGILEMEAGTHNRIGAAARRLGIHLDIGRVERGDKNRERMRKQRAATTHCNICQAQRRLRRHRTLTLTQELITDGGTSQGSDRPELDTAERVAAGAAA